MTTAMPAALTGPPTPLDEIIVGICTVIGYASVAMGGHDHPINKAFDPVLALMVLENAAADLVEATGRHTAPPMVSVFADNGPEAVRAARQTLIDVSNRLLEIAGSDQVTPAQRTLLANTLGELHKAYQDMFGENW